MGGCQSTGSAEQKPVRARSFGRALGAGRRDGAEPSSRERLRFKIFPGSSEHVRSSAAKSAVREADRQIVKDGVRNSTLLGALTERQLDGMLSLMEVFSLAEGEEWDFADSLCVVLEGELCVEQDGESVRYGKGAVLGEVGLLHSTDQTRSKAVAGGPTRVIRLTRKQYNTRLEFTRQHQIKLNVKLLESVPLFSKLSLAERLQIADECSIKRFGMHAVILRQGDRGNLFYVIRKGEAEILRFGQRVDYKYEGDWFGERALIEREPRSATVISRSHATEVLCFDTNSFKMLIGPLSEIQSRQTENENSSQLLVAVPLFTQVPANVRSELQQRFQEEAFKAGKTVFNQGEMGDKLYIIVSGSVGVFRVDGSKDIEIDQLWSGQYFGERALLKEEPRMATVKATTPLNCLVLKREDFDELRLRDCVRWSDRWEVEDTRDHMQLRVVRMMGSGSYGTVWLVQHRGTHKPYALKCLSKRRASKSGVKDVVLRERHLLASLPTHRHVISLFNTFQDARHLYMLMELAPGGELFQVLREKEDGKLTPDEARFYAGCVVLALRHLHSHNIIFRDLKPENVLLDAQGYLKLIDFGFARRLPPMDKAFTLCGTPYYLAPEMILHIGHGKGLDWWTLGVLCFEMVNGGPPFQGENEMDVYNKALRLQYTCPPDMPAELRAFLRALLELDAKRRLGNLRNGAADVMAHGWMSDFDWDALEDGRMQAPYVPAINPKTMMAHTSGPVRQQSGPDDIDLRLVTQNPDTPGYWSGW